MPCRGLRFVLSVVFYVVNENPQNRIRLKSCKKQKKIPETIGFQVLCGAAGRIRTADLVLTKDALYLLSYSSIYGDQEGARTLDLQRDRLAF